MRTYQIEQVASNLPDPVGDNNLPAVVNRSTDEHLSSAEGVGSGDELVEAAEMDGLGERDGTLADVDEPLSSLREGRAGAVGFDLTIIREGDEVEALREIP